LKKNGKVFEQHPLTGSRSNPVFLTPSLLEGFGLKKTSSFFEKKWKGF
jgi:hypothetical protein